MPILIPYAQQSIDQRDIKEVVKTLKSNYLTQGKKNLEFEKKLSNYCNSKYSVTFNSASSALQLSYISLGLKKNDLILSSPISFVATTNAAIHSGADIDFVDIDKTFCIDTNKLEDKLVKRKKSNLRMPKIVIPVHLGGLPCRMDEIKYLSKKFKFKIVEDASHAIGASYLNYKVGSCKFSDITVFSFHPVKIITTGEGGAALTNNDRIYKKLISMRSHGIVRNTNKKNKKYWIYDQKDIGWNYRLNDIQASLGISQLEKIDKFILKRNKIAKNYKKNLSDLPIKFQEINNSSRSSWHLFIILVNKKDRDNLFSYMKYHNIQVSLHYIPIYKHSYYKKLLKKKIVKKESEDYFKTAISLPMHYNLSEANQNKIIKTLKKFFNKKNNYYFNHF